MFPNPNKNNNQISKEELSKIASLGMNPQSQANKNTTSDLPAWAVNQPQTQNNYNYGQQQQQQNQDEEESYYDSQDESEDVNDNSKNNIQQNSHVQMRQETDVQHNLSSQALQGQGQVDQKDFGNKVLDSDYFPQQPKKEFEPEPEEPKEQADAENSDEDEIMPSNCLLRFYATVKFLGVCVYLGSLYSMFAYYNASRFASIYLLELFWIVLMIRPVFIVLYCFMVSYLQIHRKLSLIRRVRTTQIDDIKSNRSNPNVKVSKRPVSQDDTKTNAIVTEMKKYLPNTAELIFNFILLPIVTYSGFSRIVILSERKKSYLLASHGQEAFLHTVPLGLLAIYNCTELGMFEGIQVWAVLLALVNLSFILLETSILTSCENRGINLERKPHIKSNLRFLDMISVSMLGSFFAAGAITLSYFTLDKMRCPYGFFEENIECLPCAQELSSKCLDCVDRIECTQCETGYYIDGSNCKLCTELFGEQSVTCNIGTVLTCTEGYFVENGLCSDCFDVEGCAFGKCDARGCYECEEGLFFEDGRCYSCSSVISGCTECDSRTTCTECASKFLSIQDGVCACAGSGQFQITDKDTGACSCQSGYYLTTEGCVTCQSLVPNCFDCITQTTPTFYQLYQTASLSTEISYLDCIKCNYSFYKFTENTLQCRSCGALWDGCAVCGEVGEGCTKCYQTHVFTDDRQTPCRPCDYYMGNCEKCTSQSDCKSCRDGYSKIFGACINTPW